MKHYGRISENIIAELVYINQRECKKGWRFAILMKNRSKNVSLMKFSKDCTIVAKRRSPFKKISCVCVFHVSCSSCKKWRRKYTYNEHPNFVKYKHAKDKTKKVILFQGIFRSFTYFLSTQLVSSLWILCTNAKLGINSVNIDY